MDNIPPAEDCSLIACAIRDSIASTTQVEAKPEKKRPGRPRKKLAIHEMRFAGAITTPLIASNSVELVYTSPLLFRKIFSMFKSFEASESTFTFKPDGLHIRAIAHSQRTQIHAHILASSMNYYYAPAPSEDSLEAGISVSISQSNIDKVFSTLNESLFAISLSITNDEPHALRVAMCGLPYRDMDNYVIDVVPPTEETTELPDTSAYPLRFNIAHTHLKSKINSIHKLGKVLRFVKSRQSPLEMSIDSPNDVSIVTSFNVPNLIGLNSSMDPDRTLAICVDIDDIKPFTSNNKGSTVDIAIDFERPISFTTYLVEKNAPQGAASAAYAASLSIYAELHG